MRTRPTAAAFVLVVTLALAAGGAEPSAAAAPAAVRVSPGTSMLLTFDHSESLKRGTWVRDESGHGHGGVVRARNGGSVRPAAGWFRRGAAFPAGCCGRAIVEVADGKGLDPRRRPFAFGAAVKATWRQGRPGGNVVQKGYFNQAGGQWKLQLDPGGLPSCVVAGARGRVIAVGRRSVADGRWHRLVCTRGPRSVALRVDGKVVRIVTRATGFIGSAMPVRVGGKRVKPGNDQFHGALDSVFLRFP
jgi:hypothetical protein